MSSPSILVKQDWTPEKLTKECELPARPSHRRAVNWIDDLFNLHKVVTLCSGCLHRWRVGLKRYGYRQEKDMPYCVSNCVDCNVFDPQCSAWFHETIYTNVRCTKDERRATAQSRAKRLQAGYL